MNTVVHWNEKSFWICFAKKKENSNFTHYNHTYERERGERERERDHLTQKPDY